MFCPRTKGSKTLWTSGLSPLVYKGRDGESRGAVLDGCERVLLVSGASFSSSVSQKQQSEIRLDSRGRLQVVERDDLCAGHST